MIHYKSGYEIGLIREAGKVVHALLEDMAERIQPGVNASAVDAFAEEYIRSHNMVPSFKGYRGFPASVCFCLNDEVVHGLPTSDKMIREGDLVSVDVGVCYKGYHADAAKTWMAGGNAPENKALVQATEESLYEGIRTIHLGDRLSVLCRHIQNFLETRGYGVVHNYVGHGVGRALHEDPQVPNYWDEQFSDTVFKPGLVIAIEPMATLGHRDVYTKQDKWTIVTKDHRNSAHFEHTVALTREGVSILT